MLDDQCGPAPTTTERTVYTTPHAYASIHKEHCFKTLSINYWKYSTTKGLSKLHWYCKYIYIILCE